MIADARQGIQRAAVFLQDISFYQITLQVLTSLLNELEKKKALRMPQDCLWFYLWILYQNGVECSFLPFSKLLSFAFLISIILNCWITLHVLWGKVVCTKLVGRSIIKTWNIFKEKGITFQCHKNLNWIQAKMGYDLCSPRKYLLLRGLEYYPFVYQWVKKYSFC